MASINNPRRIVSALVIGAMLSSCTQTLKQKPGDSVASVAAMPDSAELIAAGKKQFLHCNSCHSVNPDAWGMLGPHLQNIVGRQAGALEDFEYTDAVRSLDFTWDESRLDQWLQDPQSMVPDMCIPFTGIGTETKRRALIAYLRNP